MQYGKMGVGSRLDCLAFWSCCQLFSFTKDLRLLGKHRLRVSPMSAVVLRLVQGFS